MRIRIVTTVVIDTDTGEAQSKATWHVEGQDQGLGPALHQVTAALAKLPSHSPAPLAPDPTLQEPRQHPAAREAILLGGLLDIRSDVEQALQTRPPGRVLEVLKWIKSRRATTNIRSVPSLFASLVAKD